MSENVPAEVEYKDVLPQGELHHGNPVVITVVFDVEANDFVILRLQPVLLHGKNAIQQSAHRWCRRRQASSCHGQRSGESRSSLIRHPWVAPRVRGVRGEVRGRRRGNRRWRKE